MDLSLPESAGRDAEELFLSVVDLSPERRADRLAGVEVEVRSEVESMLAGLAAGAWLEEPLCDRDLSIASLLDRGS